MEALSHKMNNLVSKQAISKYETGKMLPSESVLSVLVTTLNLPYTYFTTSPLHIGSINFRIDKNMPVQSTEQMISVVSDKMERYLKVENILALHTTFKNPIKNVEINKYENIEAAACMLRKKWELGAMSIFSVYEMLESYGIKIIEFDCGVKHVIGFSTIVNKKIPLIVINTAANFTTERKRFTALHELGHILLNFTSDIEEGIQERMCNYFAGALLCPKQVLIRELGIFREHITLEELTSVKTRYGISIAAIVHRAKDLGIISDTYYNDIFDNHIHKNIMEEGWGEYPIKEQTDHYERLLQRVVAEKYVTQDELLGILDDKSEKMIKEMTILD